MEPTTNTEIEDERLKLQHDIQRIQDTLYDDSYSEYDSDSDPECLEIDLDNRNQTDEDTRTRSSIGESSVSHFGGTEISDGTDYEQELFVGDSSSTELPVTIESSLALNRAYQEVITDILCQIEQSLETNRQKQEDAETDLIGQRERNLNLAQFKVYYKQYAMPYIKDPSGGVPPPNEDVKLKKMLKEHKQDIYPERDWMSRDRNRMYDAVAEDALQQLLQPLMIRLELEQEKLERCSKGDEPAISARIIELEEDIACKGITPREDLLNNVDVTKTDWLKISNIAYDGRKTWQECQMMWRNVLNPKVNHGVWETAEDNQLKLIVQKFKGKNWEKIAEALMTCRTPFQCLQRYQTCLNPENTNRPWTVEEDNRLLEVVSDIRNRGHRLIWAKVSSYMENRSGIMCFNRFHQIDPDMRRGAWTKGEDVSLSAAVNMCGTNSWMRIAEFVPGRSALQCRDRWYNSLDPTLRMGNWSYEEDKALLKLAAELGTKSWTKIANRLPGRTDNMVLQRFKRLQNWERKTQWFKELPEVTKRALLGGHLSPEELKEKEQLTWQNFQKELCVQQEDYEKQEKDRLKGNVVVPRPPPLLGYCTMIPTRIIDSRIHLQNLIMKHVRAIEGEEPLSDVHESDTRQELASKFHFVDGKNMSVKKLLELSKKIKARLGRGLPCGKLGDRPRSKSKQNQLFCSKFNFKAMKNNRKWEGMLRESVQSIFKTRKKLKKGRPRKFFNRVMIGQFPEDEIHNIKVKSLNLVMKALDINAKKMLTSATKFKEQRSSSQSASASVSAVPSAIPPPAKPKLPTRAKTPGRVGESDKNVFEEEPTGDVDMLQYVSEKEAEESDEGQKVAGETEEVIVMESVQTEPEQGCIATSDGLNEDVQEITATESRSEKVQESSKTDTAPLQTAASETDTATLQTAASETPKRKTVTFVENTNDVSSTDKAATPKKSLVIKSALKQNTFQSTSNTGSVASDSSSPVASTSTSSIPSTTTTSTQISDPDSSEDEIVDDAKSLPLLPPSVTTLDAFKTLLLKRKKNIANAGPMYSPRFYHLPESLKRAVNKEESVVIRKRERGTGTDSSEGPVTKTKRTTEPLTKTQLRELRRSDDYQQFRARFQSIFVWPALMSTIHPPFHRKDFLEKANFITAGEKEVEYVKRTRTKGYALDRSRKFYKRMVRTREQKLEDKKKKKGRPSISVAGKSVNPTVSADSSNNAGAGPANPVDQTVRGEVILVDIDAPVGPQVKKRGRPKGKAKPFRVAESSRTMRGRKEKIVPEKTAAKQITKKRVGKRRALLAPDLRRSMLNSMEAMEKGMRPDPASNIHVSKPVKRVIKPSVVTENYTVFLASDLEELDRRAAADREAARLKKAEEVRAFVQKKRRRKKKKDINPEDVVRKRVVKRKPIISTTMAQSTAVASSSSSALSTTGTTVSVTRRINTPGSISDDSVSVPIPVSVVTTDITPTNSKETISLPLGSCSGVPMMLSYVSGNDGNVVPILNPVPVSLLQNANTESQVKVEKASVSTKNDSVKEGSETSPS